MDKLTDLIEHYTEETMAELFKQGWGISYWPDIGFILRAPAPYDEITTAKIVVGANKHA